MKCKKHPRYKAVYPPTTEQQCDCWKVWEEQQKLLEEAKSVSSGNGMASLMNRAGL